MADADAKRLDPDQRMAKFLTRALAAFCIHKITNAEPQEAANSITDGFDDQGIDAIYFDVSECALYLVQSKWSSAATKTIDSGDMHKFLCGTRRLICADFS